MTLADNLPPFVAEEKYTKEVLDAIQPEIDKIKMHLINTLFELCVSTCSDNGIKRFEKDYAIRYDAELSLDERKRQIINKMLAKKRLTKDEFANFIKRNIDGKQFYISNEAEQYRFAVRIIDEEYKEKLYKAVYEMKPAHLVFEIIIVSYERRCGTFKTNENVL